MSNLKFPEEVTVSTTTPKYKSYFGRSIDNMPRLLAEGRYLITPKQLMYARVHEKNKYDRDLLRDNYIYAACAVCVAPDRTGEVAIGLYSHPTVKQVIDSLSPESNVVGGSLVLTPDQYNAVKDNAFVLSPVVANSLRNNAYSELKKREAFWEYVAEGDKKLVTDTRKLVKEKSGSGNLENRMGLFLTSTTGLRLLYLGPVGNSNGNALGDSYLDDLNGRCVGVAGGVYTPKARREKALLLEDVLNLVLPHIAPFLHDRVRRKLGRLYKL